EDFMKPDRVVIGVESARAKEIMGDIYRPLYLRDFPIDYTGLETAEMIKYASNSFPATKISSLNEIAALGARVGADAKYVASALARIGQEHGCPMRITETVISVNDAVKRRMIDKVLDLCEETVNGKTVAVLGVTFKPETDDMRDSPSLTIVPALIGGGAKVRV